MTTLILSPIFAVTLSSQTSPVAVRDTVTAPARTAANVQGITPMLISELREPQTEAPSAAPVPPPPPARPAPVVVKAVVVKHVTPRAPAPKRPAATPLPAAGPPASPTSIIGIIEAAAARWGVSGSWMVSIARCESGLRPTAVNPSGPYIGLFQFLQSTFRANGGTNIWDPTDQANVTAKMLAHGQAHQWSCA